MEIVTVNLSNYYWYFKSVVPPRICDDIIRYGLSQAETFARTGGYGEDRELTKQEIKDRLIIKVRHFTINIHYSCSHSPN